MSKTVRVGVMPGRIEEFAVEAGTSIASLLEIANLDAAGYDVKVDGAKVTDLDSATVTESTNLVLLAKQVKGNAEKTVRVGVMPGRINEFAVTTGTTISEVLALAGLDATGYDVKVDGSKVTEFESATVTESTNLILLAKQVKGNADKTVRIGVMPGRIEEYALNTDTSIADALQLAGLDATGYDVKVDGSKVTELNSTYITDSTNLILLAKQVKGN